MRVGLHTREIYVISNLSCGPDYRALEDLLGVDTIPKELSLKPENKPNKTAVNGASLDKVVVYERASRPETVFLSIYY